MEINNRVDNEGEAGTPNIEGEKECDKCTADKRTKHWNEAKDASDETERQSEAWVEAEEEGENKDHCRSATGVDEGDGKRVGNVF